MTCEQASEANTIASSDLTKAVLKVLLVVAKAGLAERWRAEFPFINIGNDPACLIRHSGAQTIARYTSSDHSSAPTVQTKKSRKGMK